MGATETPTKRDSSAVSHEAAMTIKNMEERRNQPMGAKAMRKILAVLVAAAVMMTSGIAVFAADTPSSQSGSTAAPTTVEVSGSSITVSNANGQTVEYKLSSSSKWTAVSGNTISGLKTGKKYEIKVGNTTYKRLIAKGKIKSAKKKGKKATVKFKKKKGAKKYVVTAINTETGKKITKTVKSLSATLKLKKGTWKITVTPKNGAYKGQASKAKTVKIK